MQALCPATRDEDSIKAIAGNFVGTALQVVLEESDGMAGIRTSRNGYAPRLGSAMRAERGTAVRGQEG